MSILTALDLPDADSDATVEAVPHAVVVLPTCELLGLLGDVLPFVTDDPESPGTSVVQVSWDRRQLHVMGTDRFRAGWSTWDPADPPDEDAQLAIGYAWGGDHGAPWTAVISHTDATAIRKAYKLRRDLRWTPLVVTLNQTGGLLTIRRPTDFGCPVLTMEIEQPPPIDDLPDIPGLLARLDHAKARRTVRFNASYLADFASVRARGPLELTFTADGMCLVAIGGRFTGAIAPLGEEPRPPADPAGRGVFDDSIPPGGYVCGVPTDDGIEHPVHGRICGMPVESEPCTIHHPGAPS